ncbi:MAG: DUF86 domain-containing protein [Betaproteobacteria bacterium]|nr:DUF86 domain-containing protein [Betaproteobacteria bacterium]
MARSPAGQMHVIPKILSRRIAARQPRSARALAADEDLQDILARNLEVAIQTCADIAFHLCAAHRTMPASAGDAFAELGRLGLIDRVLAERLRLAAGFRNVLVHEYIQVDWKIVLQAARTGTRDLAVFGKAVVKILEEQPDPS